MIFALYRDDGSRKSVNFRIDEKLKNDVDAILDEIVSERPILFFRESITNR